MWEYSATVLRIVDADTIDFSISVGFDVYVKERLRLARIDAWEVRGEEREQGLRAKARVQELLPVGTVVTIQTSKKGKYGRYIAEVLLGSLVEGGEPVNLSDLLLAEGHAEEYGK